ncbi:Aminopeptidase C [Candidatus Zixiibacteriota bacterium]|nr:Aminopeptidase C [candidate division Zixibacteria bacterium]
MRFFLLLKIALTLSLFGLVAVSSISAAEGALTPEMVDQYRANLQLDGRARAIYNAVSGNDINNLALNRDLLRQQNDLFSHKIKTKGITNQKSSGRCWLFAGLNIMRPVVIDKYKLANFEFSESYLSFWDKMEKSNCFLEDIIAMRDRDPLDREMEMTLSDPIGDGGWWNYVVALIEKYGAVPKDVMPESFNSENTGGMNSLLSRKLRADTVRLREMAKDSASVEDLRAEKVKMLSEIYKMLVLNFGEPPREFTWRFEGKDSTLSASKVYTPQTFYRDFVGVDLNQYVNLFNYPAQDFGKHYQVQGARNMYDAHFMDFVNVESSVLMDVAMKSILDDEPVWFSCDVGKDQYGAKGLMATNIYDYGSVYGTDFGMSKADKIMYRDITANHAMALVGVDVKDNRPVKWLVENSWGSDKGNSGYWTMTGNWFDNYVFNVIVKKKYLPKEILPVFDQTAITLPPWDPMMQIIRHTE